MDQIATTARLSALLVLLMFADAVVLGVALYALTRDQDPDLAMLALCFRVTEGVLATVAAIHALGLLSVATASTAAAANALGAFKFRASDSRLNVAG